jgi:S-adenosylmethionine decarboxylase
MDALMPLGMVSEHPSENQAWDDLADARALPEATDFGEAKDYFVVRDGQTFAGMHLLVDLWEARKLCDPAHIDASLQRAALAAGATILHSHFHHFSPNGGVSGVLVLAESHISIHTWPERDFAAVDIFMCGECDPYLSVPMLREAFQPGRVDLSEQRRGLIR